MQDKKCNDSASIVTQVLEEMKQEQGEKFSLESVNLSELARRTGVSRKKLRRLKRNGFQEKPHGLTGTKATVTVLTGYTGIIDHLLSSGVYNSAVFFERLQEAGYQGGISQVKQYMLEHKYLLPAKRQLVSPQGNRGRRYVTGPGEACQMDWGFVKVDCIDGSSFQAACFAMICHHCGQRYVEFFPNARQENLFIGMVHAFLYMGIPQRVLTDNMKSVVLHRDAEGKPIWQHDYEIFMRTVGFETRLCKPRHPFTKGAVERLVRFVKENFAVGRSFYNFNDLNAEALDWCNRQNSMYHRCVDCIPADLHRESCMLTAKPVVRTLEVASYLCPVRTISFDGFVNYEGRRFGVPYWYTERLCRVKREGNSLCIYNMDMTIQLAVHPVTWSKKDSFCPDQYLEQPEEQPTMPVRSVMNQLAPPKSGSGFSKFHFDIEEEWDNG